MDASLIPHPTTADGPVRSIDVHVTRVTPAELTLRYRLVGDVAQLRIPEPAAPARTDGLWQHTCFEAFVGPFEGAAYCEFNFSPSSQWAAYAFDAYRDGMTSLDVQAPSIRTRLSDGELTVRALVDLSAAPMLSDDIGWQLALSAVVEDCDGRRSYWALNHAPGKPDFHHRDCFVLELPPAKPA